MNEKRIENEKNSDYALNLSKEFVNAYRENPTNLVCEEYLNKMKGVYSLKVWSDEFFNLKCFFTPQGGDKDKEIMINDKCYSDDIEHFVCSVISSHYLMNSWEVIKSEKEKEIKLIRLYAKSNQLEYLLDKYEFIINKMPESKRNDVNLVVDFLCDYLKK